MKKGRTKSKVRRGTIRKVIETPSMLAIIDVPVVYPPEMPQSPLLEAKTVKFLDEACRRTLAGDKAWLRKHGAKLYVDSPAA
jgi:hypothetical protein